MIKKSIKAIKICQLYCLPYISTRAFDLKNILHFIVMEIQLQEELDSHLCLHV